MKKLVVFNLIILLFACKSNPVTKMANKAESQLKGNWKIVAVNYAGSDYMKVKSFDIADSKCFVGSSWKFVANNNTGEMSLNDSSCPAYSSKITWYINKEDNLVMKFLDLNNKAKKVTQGYVLSVSIQSENSFQLIDKINVGGKLADIVYQFEKII